MPYYSITETIEFTEVVYEYFQDDEAFLVLQDYLMRNPVSGEVIKDAGGLRKLRWPDSRRGKGKRGGLRLIYLHVPEFERFLLLDVYGKDEQEDLNADERQELRQLANEYRAALSKKKGSQK